MTCVITGDIIESRNRKKGIWLQPIKNLLKEFGSTPKQWEIYRGDEFQLELKPEDAMSAIIMIKACLKDIKMDARMSIGIGEKTYSAAKVSQSNGTAFIRSGESFNMLKEQRTTVLINSGNEVWDMEMNIILRLVETITNSWLQPSAEFIFIAQQNPELSQEQIGEKLNITQAAVSKRQKRSNYELIMDVEKFYREKVKLLS